MHMKKREGDLAVACVQDGKVFCIPEFWGKKLKADQLINMYMYLGFTRATVLLDLYIAPQERERERKRERDANYVR